MCWLTADYLWFAAPYRLEKGLLELCYRERRLRNRHDLDRRTPWLAACSALCLGSAKADACAATHQLWCGSTTGRPLPSGPPTWHPALVRFSPPERAPSSDRRARHCSCKSGRFLHREREPPATDQAQVASPEQRCRTPPVLALGRVVAMGVASKDGHVLTSIAPRTIILMRFPLRAAQQPAVGRVAAAGSRAAALQPRSLKAQHGGTPWRGSLTTMLYATSH